MNAKELIKDIKNIEYVKEIPANNIVTGKWVRMKCRYGCSFYGKSLSCPPEVPPVNECIEIIREYRRALFIKFSKSSMRKCNETVLEIERVLFRHGFYRAFAFFVTPCREKNTVKCRPTAEAFGIDLIGTAKKIGLEAGRLPVGVVLVE